MKLLHIDAGITGPGSVSRQLSATLVEALKARAPWLEVVRRDLDADPIAHLDSRSVGSLRGSDGDQDAEAETSRAILDEFLDADIVVLGAPMYNLGIPSQLKAWFDRILIAGRTFRYTANGPEGLVRGKTVLIASARGGVYTPGSPQAAADFHEPYLRALFGFIGVKDVAILRAEGVNLGPDQRDAAIRAATETAAKVVADLAPALAA